MSSTQNIHFPSYPSLSLVTLADDMIFQSAFFSFSLFFPLTYDVNFFKFKGNNHHLSLSFF